jgi:hypothetical protein
VNRFLKKNQNTIGWLGAIATLLAYFLVSFELVKPKDLSYQVLNLAGAIGLGIVCYFKKTYQPMTVNIIWGIIALLAIFFIITTLS